MTTSPIINYGLVSGLLLLGDLLGVYLSLLFAARIRAWLIPWVGGVVYWPAYTPVVYLCLGFTAFVFLFNGLYPGYGLTAVRELASLIRLNTLIFAFLGVSIYVLKSPAFIDFPRSIFLIAWLISLLIVPLFRFFIRNRISLYDWYGIPIVLIIEDLIPDQILESAIRCRRMGWNVLAIYSIGSNPIKSGANDIPMIHSLDELMEYRERNHIQTAIISSLFKGGDITRKGDSWRSMSSIFKNVILMMPGENLASVWVEPRDLEGRLGLELTFHLLDPYAKIIKKFIDGIGSLLLIFLLSPIILVISIAIYLDSPGPIFYQQERLGRDGMIFLALKFRTMRVGADRELEQLLSEDPTFKEEYQTYHKLSNDPRITTVGKFLRKYSLDELPQLWNVIKGEMSLVGPRAYMPEELGDMGTYADLILKVHPGMTGWWQVMGRQNTTFQARLRMDEYYLSNWSLWMDIYIIIKTLWVVLSGTGT